MREAALGPNHADVADALHILAIVYSDQGRYVEAEKLYKRVIAIREALPETDLGDIANAINDLANLYDNEGRYDEAEGLTSAR